MRLTRLLPLLLLMAILAVPGMALPTIIDFATGQAGFGGTISYAGGNAPLVGDDIRIGQVSGINTPLNSGNTSTVTGACGGFGCLDFMTGAFVGMDGASYVFGSGGFLTITGSGPNGSGPTLLTAPVISATLSPLGAISLTIVSGSDTKDPDLLAYFGLPADTLFQFTGTIFAAAPTIGANGGFSVTATGSTDIQNVVVPEPGSVMLFGTVLIGVAGLLRRIRS